jgi:hypothetical protein
MYDRQITDAIRDRYRNHNTVYKRESCYADQSHYQFRKNVLNTKPSFSSPTQSPVAKKLVRNILYSMRDIIRLT